MITKFLPKSMKSWLREQIKRVAREIRPGVAELKYIPYKDGYNSYLIPKDPTDGCEIGSPGLPIPPKELGWLAPTKEIFLGKGERDARKMVELVQASGLTLTGGQRILDLGCGAGRMIRFLKSFADSCEIWGTDIRSDCIYWCKQHLSPPFHFATTTTIPHLPFEDKYFNLIYCGSVFTHIDDLSEAWLLEIRRVLSPHGRFYVTIHDNHTIKLLHEDPPEGPLADKGLGLAKVLKDNEFYDQVMKGNLGMLVIGRDVGSQVFYDTGYFRGVIESSLYDIITVTQEGYGYQTAYVVRRKD
jgi:SAM-dependent methyltransferase